MNEAIKSWKTEALGKNGKTYFTLMCVLPIIPSGLLALVWYVFISPEQSWEKIPFVLLGIVFLFAAVLLHQVVQVIRFIKLASRTARKISIMPNNEVELELFSNRKVVLPQIGWVTFTLSLPQDKEPILQGESRLHWQTASCCGNLCCVL